VAAKRAEPGYSYSRAWRMVSIILLRPTLRLLLKRDWAGQQNIPRTGGLILAPNHVSYADVFAVMLFSYESGRYPVFLAKDTIFKIKVLGSVVTKLGQLPVHRGKTDAALVLTDAERGIADGACVIVYPEATCTRDPDLWPMTAKTGVARLALSTGAPVIPIAHWGTQNVLPYGSKTPHLFPRRTIRMVAGPPVDLSEFRDKPVDAATLRAATTTVMRDITGLLAALRSEQPPAAPYDPRVDGKGRREGPDTGTDASMDPGAEARAESGAEAATAGTGPAHPVAGPEAGSNR
jgi:1-acyl-sn-glycerol-3-phosphate acyltransferase